jgi:5-formyltetrahydrofolate cyclo-ligase
VAALFSPVLFTRARMDAPDKSAWRQRVREALRAMTPDTRAAVSRELCRRLSQSPVWSRAKRVLCFAPLSDEPDILPLIEEALLMKFTVALPRFDAKSGWYEAALLSGLAGCERGAFGALEPDGGCPVIPLNQLDLVLVPAVAFDFAGRRLGRGKGFYDRLLAEVRGHTCGVCFDEQIVAELPEEPHDVRVNSIVTPTRWLDCGVER